MNYCHSILVHILLPFLLSPLFKANINVLSFCISSPHALNIKGQRLQRTFRPDFKHGLQEKKEDVDNDKIIDTFNIDEINTLEIRLDATLLTIYVLGRFLVYDITTGIKSTPGWELHDVILILQTFSSAIVLSALWTLTGVFLTRIFKFDDEFIWKEIITTTIITVPLWIAIEIFFCWPTAGVLWSQITGGLDGMLLGNQESLFFLFTLISASTLGVGCTMTFGRLIRKYIA